MPAIINSVEKDSIAEDIGLSQGDEIVSVNNKKITDLIEYRYFLCSENIDLHIKKADNTEEIIEIEKDFEEDLGITFESAVFDRVKPCTNKCIFCFVDQQPEGLRKTLYIKDDDYRLSYLQGTYVTLTNLTEKDRKRIEAMRLGPLYISVHTTNPELRVKMLKNPKAASIYEELKWLNKLEIPVHVQIVLCPGFNDGKELKRSLKDLAKLKSNILSIAIVPVGLTKYRKTTELIKVDKNKAVEVISMLNDFNKSVGHNLASVSDEFYLIAGEDFPKESYYNGFGQLDDGVGTSRLLLDDFKRQKSKLPKAIKNKKRISIVTGLIAEKTISIIANNLNKIENLATETIAIKSDFWGDDVTVSGLITGQDIIKRLQSEKNIDGEIIIPAVMIRPYTEDFLDGYTLSEVSSKIGKKIHKIENFYSTEELINLIQSFK